MRPPWTDRCRGLRGFTLVEMILALGIFVLLAGAIFASVQAVTTASAVLGEEQVRARRLDAFLSWCRQGFRNLPARAEVLLRTRDTGAAGLAVDLLIRRAPGAFSLGEFDAQGPDLVLSALPDGRGGATLSVARYPGSWNLNEITQNLREEDWVPLLRDIRLLRWTFWDAVQEQFVEQWPEGRPRPELMRLELTLQTGEEYVAVFRLPPLEFRGDFSGEAENAQQQDGAENTPNDPNVPETLNAPPNPNVPPTISPGQGRNPRINVP